MQFQDGFESTRQKSPGLRIVSVLGLEVRVHWLLPVVLALFFVDHVARGVHVPHPILGWLAFVAAVGLAVLVHELAHAYAFFRAGAPAHQILLRPLGGSPEIPRGYDPPERFWLAASGPLSDAVKALSAAALCLALGWGLLPTSGDEPGWWLRLLVQYSFLWNSVLLVSNTLPCLPLDGGYMMEAVGRSMGADPSPAAERALRVSRVTAFLAIGGSLLLFIVATFQNNFPLEHPFLHHLGIGLLLVAGRHFVAARALDHRAAMAGEEEELFGYDFSLGYTSLESTMTRGPKHRSLMATVRKRFRDHKRQHEKLQDDRMRELLDEVLTKIHAGGLKSLTSKEKRFLQRASRRLRQVG